AAAPRRQDIRAEKVHAKNVDLLPRHVHFAHVDDALEPEERAGGGGGDAVLSRAGLGDDPLLPYPLRDQRLTDSVVDLVRAGVIQIFAFQKEPERPAQLREPPRLGWADRSARAARS